MSAKADADLALARVLADLAMEARSDAEEWTDGQAAEALESSRAAGLATMRQVERILGNPSDTFLAVQASEAVAEAFDAVDLCPDECPRLAAACAEEWRRAFLCH